MRPLLGGVLALVTATVLGLGLSCASSDDDDAGNGSSGGTSSSGFQPSDPPDSGFTPCVAKEAEAVEGKRPIDIIFVIDNSESMSEEIAEVERQINQNFVDIISAANVDYRLIMISGHGTHDADAGINAVQRICVKAPLSSTNCDPVPAAPAETPNFLHYNVVVNSTDAWCTLLTTFSGSGDLSGAHTQGWGPFLRPGAFKVIAVITDDRVHVSCRGQEFNDNFDDPGAGANAAARFEAQLFTLSPLHFGSTAKRNYVWHSIVALAPFDSDDLSLPHPPSAPVISAMCTPSAVAPGTGHQALSRLTGGLRYPTCGGDFTTIFRAMAEDAIAKTVVACDYELPKPASGAIDRATAVVRYTSGTNIVNDFQQIAGAGECGPGKFFIEGDRIKLCPEACTTVQSDDGADVKILFGCLPRQTN